MRLFTSRRIVALVALAPALFLFSAVPGCSNQAEGERCGDDVTVNNDDCTAPLVCTKFNDNDFGRCCDPNPSIVHDSRCLRSGNTASGGSGGSATAGTGGSAGGSDLGGTTGLAGTGGSAAGGTDGADASTAGMSSGGI